jgi:O-antigen ligase
VKDYIIQSVEFVICTFAIAHLAIEAWRRRQRAFALGLVFVALLFLANVAFVAAGRTALVAFPVLLILFGAQRFGWKGTLGIIIAGILAAILAWTSSSYLRERALGVVDEIQLYQRSNGETSVGYRLEFWKKSLGFIAEAPVIGNGTGAIPGLFRRAAIGNGDVRAAVTGNPHNQMLELAIQFGLIGVAVLFAMWIAHLMMFASRGVMPWLGQGLVVQTVIGALFLSYLLDFTTGWLYVLGVGTLGGTAAVAERGPCIARKDARE